MGCSRPCRRWKTLSPDSFNAAEFWENEEDAVYDGL